MKGVRKFIRLFLLPQNTIFCWEAQDLPLPTHMRGPFAPNGFSFIFPLNENFKKKSSN